MKVTIDSEKIAETLVPAAKATCKAFWTLGAGILGATIDAVATAQKEYAVAKGTPTPLEKAKAEVEETSK